MLHWTLLNGLLTCRYLSPFLYLFLRFFIYLFVYSFINPFIVIHSFIQLFIFILFHFLFLSSQRTQARHLTSSTFATDRGWRQTTSYKTTSSSWTSATRKCCSAPLLESRLPAIFYILTRMRININLVREDLEPEKEFEVRGSVPEPKPLSPVAHTSREEPANDTSSDVVEIGKSRTTSRKYAFLPYRQTPPFWVNLRSGPSLPPGPRGTGDEFFFDKLLSSPSRTTRKRRAWPQVILSRRLLHKMMISEFSFHSSYSRSSLETQYVAAIYFQIVSSLNVFFTT